MPTLSQGLLSFYALCQCRGAQRSWQEHSQNSTEHHAQYTHRGRITAQGLAGHGEVGGEQLCCATLVLLSLFVISLFLTAIIILFYFLSVI